MLGVLVRVRGVLGVLVRVRGVLGVLVRVRGVLGMLVRVRGSVRGACEGEGLSPSLFLPLAHDGRVLQIGVGVCSWETRSCK